MEDRDDETCEGEPFTQLDLQDKFIPPITLVLTYIVVWFQFWSRDEVVELEFPSKALTAWVRARLHAWDKSFKELNLVNAIVFLYLI